jgi:hypothetical protein
MRPIWVEQSDLYTQACDRNLGGRSPYELNFSRLQPPGPRRWDELSPLLKQEERIHNGINSELSARPCHESLDSFSPQK